MYSYDERKKAVELYIKFDKSACSVVRELGYPTFNMLKLWYREYLEEGDLHKKSRMQSGYSADQKKAAIQYYQEHGRSLTRTVKALGYPCRQLLGKWVHKDLPANCHPVKRGQSVVQYTDEQKVNAVVSVVSGEKTAKELEAEIGVTRSTVSHWKRQLLGKGEMSAMGKEKPRKASKNQSGQKTDLREECTNLKEERDSLQRQVYQLQMEKDILEKAATTLKKRKGIDIEKLSNREKAMLVDALTGRYPIKNLLASVHMGSAR